MVEDIGDTQLCVFPKFNQQFVIKSEVRCTYRNIIKRNDSLRKMKGLLFALGLLFAVQGPARCTNEDDNQEDLELDTLDRGPYFDVSASRNVTALVGNTAVLNCRVRNLGDRTRLRIADGNMSVFSSDDVHGSVADGHVFAIRDPTQETSRLIMLTSPKVSWVRHRDIHLLTVGIDTYTSDSRFVAAHYPRTEDWTLQVKFPQRRDSGTYECQVSTTPPIGHSMHLSVVEPVTTVVGGPEMYINRGSTMNLTCVVRHSPEPPPAIYWTHNEEEINYDSPRGGVSVITEKGEITTSYLLVQRAQQADSGRYTCHPSNANWKTVVVHVLNGEHPAAMQHGGQLRLGNPPFVILLASLLAFLNHRH